MIKNSYIMGLSVLALALAGGGMGFDGNDGFNLLRVIKSERPDRIKPYPGFVSDLTPGEDAVVKLYEYTHTYITTGRSQTFRIEKPYGPGRGPYDGAPVFRTKMAFDLEDRTPLQRSEGVYRRKGFDRIYDSVNEFEAHRQVIATLSSSSPHRGFRRRLNGLKAARAEPAVKPGDIKPGPRTTGPPYHWLGRTYCGYKMFEAQDISNRLARAKQIYPFNTASVFARPDGTGGYEQVVTCNHVSRFGWCWIDELYRPINGTLRVNFGGPQLCERADEVVAAARQMFADRLIAETEPVPGWGKK